MDIVICKGTGVGKTRIAALDAALDAARVADFNLINMTSVIPPCSRLLFGHTPQHDASYGDRLYVVKALSCTERHGQEAWAGLAWWQQDNTLSGVFVEATGNSQAALKADLTNSLSEIVKRRTGRIPQVQMEIAGIRCDMHPVCSVVLAVYGSEEWVSSNYSWSRGYV